VTGAYGYTHRIAISSARLISMSDDKIVFRTRGDNTCSIPPEQFLRRFLLHVLPHQFFKIRHYGLLAPGNVNTRLRRAQELLGPVPEAAETVSPAPLLSDNDGSQTGDHASAVVAGAPKCPHCGGKLVRGSGRRLCLVELPPPDSS
jgi:hypothetical protein